MILKNKIISWGHYFQKLASPLSFANDVVHSLRKYMKYSNIAKLKDTELKKKLRGNQEKLRVFRFGNAMGKSKDVKEGMNTQREIARILTEMGVRKRAGN